MGKHHKEWLKKHPNRTEGWLKAKQADGFDIHHVDGNHENNHPDNLVLIECFDHMRLHGSNMNRILRKKKIGIKEKRQKYGSVSYFARQSGMRWVDIFDKYCSSEDVLAKESFVSLAAKDYAYENNLVWPVEVRLASGEIDRRPKMTSMMMRKRYQRKVEGNG